MIRSLYLAGAAFAVAFASQSAIAAPAPPRVIVGQVAVAYGDLDTRTPSGKAALKARISAAANQACGGSPVFHTQFRDAPNLVRADFEHCRAKAQDTAFVFLQQRGVTVADNR